MSRVLIVEDEVNIALGLEDNLRLEGYETKVAEDAEEAERLLEEGTYDLILLDIMLPGKDGIQFCKELRQRGETIPVILVTARSQEADKVLGLEYGADDYITKPFSPIELCARVKAVLRRTDQDEPARYEFGPFRVDFSRMELTRAGEPVDLTPQEFKVLSALIRNRGKALSRDELLDQAWGEDVFVVDRVVDTQVANLRKKIEEDPSEPRYLVSIRGLGYRFDG